MGSRPVQTSPRTAIKQGEKFQDKSSRPAVEQVSSTVDKREEKGPSSPTVVQQTSKQSTVNQETTEPAGPITPSSSNPPESKAEKAPQPEAAPSKDSKSANVKEDEMSWSPPPPEPPQKPLSFPLTGVDDSSQRNDNTNKVPFGAALTNKGPSFSGRNENESKEETALTNPNDPPFQSQVMKGQGHQYKKSTQYRYDRQQQPPQQQQQTPPQQTPPPTKSEPVHNESLNTERTQPQNTQSQSDNTPFGRRKSGGPPGGGRWGKTDRPPRRSEPHPSPMETEYEMAPNVDRSILNAEPKEHVKKFTNRSRLFIGGILNADEKLLKDMFIKFGEISELWLNKEKGFGFVKMDTRANCQRAIDHYNGQERMNTMVRVRFAAKNSSVKVTNLTHAVTNELLEEAFKIFGDVEHAVVACDERGKSIGWGIVDFAMKKSATIAIARCKEGLFMLCKSPIPVMVTELKEEDLEEGVVEKTMHKNVLYQREREDKPRFAMPGSTDYQIAMKWKLFLENARSEREMLEERLKAEKNQLENETENELIRFLEEQDHIRHQEVLRRQEEQRRVEDSRKQDYLRQQEMIKQENRRRNQSTRLQEELKRREESLRREGEMMPPREDRAYDRPYGQSEVSFGYSQDYEHGCSSEKNSDWQGSRKDWGNESAQGFGAGSGYPAQGRTTQSGYEDYPGYSTQSQHGDAFNKDKGISSQSQYGSGDQFRNESRHSGGGYGGYSSVTGATGAESYRDYGSAAHSSAGYQSDSGYGAGYGLTTSQALQNSADRSWTSQRQDQGYDGMFSGGMESAGAGGGYDRRRPHTDDWQAERIDYYAGLDKRRKL